LWPSHIGFTFPSSFLRGPNQTRTDVLPYLQLP
jgi:hypothetical protein